MSDPTNVAAPADVGVPATGAPADFRGIKTYIRDIITGTVDFLGDAVFKNTRGVRIKSFAGVTRLLVQMNAANVVTLGNSAVPSESGLVLTGNTVELASAGGTAVTVSANRNVTIAAPSSGAALSLAGTGGLIVAAGQSTLTNYLEDAVWTPAIVGLLTGGAATMTYREGLFARVGRWITAITSVTFTGHTGTGQIVVPIPATVSALAAGADRVIGTWFGTVPTGAPAVPMYGVVVIPGGVTDSARLYYSDSAANNQALIAVMGAGLTNLTINLSYRS